MPLPALPIDPVLPALLAALEGTGVAVLQAPPGAGKTTLVLQVCIGVCRHHAENDAVVVVVSLDMSAHDLLDRLQVAVAPLIIGDGRPAIRLPQPPAALGDCHRPRYRVFRMGGDILFDCDLRAVADDGDRSSAGLLSRVI